MAIDFPNTPTVGQQFIAAGLAWSWDGSKWVNATNIPSGYAPLNSPPFTGNPTAPTPPYGDNDTSLATTAFVQSAVAPALNNVGRNLIHNPLFNVAQRGNGPFAATSAYSLDRWVVAYIGGSTSVQRQPMGDPDRASVGDEYARFCLSTAVTGTAAAGDVSSIAHFIEDVSRLSGKTVTVSFYANSTIANFKVGVSIDQYFGTGGSPSAPVRQNGQAVTLSGTIAAWTRNVVTLTIPSIAGKTLGTNNDHYTQLNFFFSSGATNAARAGNIGVQTGLVNLWGVQLEIGSVATPLEKPDPQQDLAKCQRFYQIAYSTIQINAVAGGAYANQVSFACPMRATPTVIMTASVAGRLNVNGSFPVMANPSPIGFSATIVSVLAGDTYDISRLWTASADL